MRPPIFHRRSFYVIVGEKGGIKVNIDDLMLLDWHEDLEAMSVIELAEWILRQRLKAYVNNELNGDRLEQLYREFAFCYETSSDDLPSDMPDELIELFERNQKLMRGKSQKQAKRQNYRKAVRLLSTPIPRFRFRAKGDTHSIYIRHWVYRHHPELSIQQALRQVEQEIKSIDALLYKKGRPDENYRAALREWIRTRETKREATEYKEPGVAKETIQKYEEEREKRAIYIDEIFMDVMYLHTPRDLEAYGVDRSMVKRFLEGRCEKNTMIRIAFFLGLMDDEAEVFLQKEGFSLATSVRTEDEIFRNCFKFGLPISHANALLIRFKKKPLSGVTVQ